MNLLKTPRLQPNPTGAIRALNSLSPAALAPYRTYFETITPGNPTEIFRRGLFAFASVHTSWQYNLALYVRLWDLDWLDDEAELRRRIQASRAGLTDGRTRSIWLFRQQYWANPGFYLRKPNEPWPAYRDRLKEVTLGLGHAKTSFFLELVFPNEAEIVCGDTHQLQLYGLRGNSSPTPAIYDFVESHWVLECRKLGLAPVASRWALWDLKQGHTDSRYWSHVLEGKPELPDKYAKQLLLFPDETKMTA